MRRNENQLKRGPRPHAFIVQGEHHPILEHLLAAAADRDARTVGITSASAAPAASARSRLLRRSDHDGARSCYEEAPPLYRLVGSMLGEANCILGLGDLAAGTGETETARRLIGEALELYERIAEPHWPRGQMLSLGLAMNPVVAEMWQRIKPRLSPT